MKISQCDVILKTMLQNRFKKYWYAKDFQSGRSFVGYEASARMSDLMRLYPEIVIAERDGRFRTLRINWKNKQAIKELKTQKEW